MTDGLIVIFLLCLLVSFVASGMEAGVFTLNRLRVRNLSRSGLRAAELLTAQLEKPERFLWTILLGNTLANFVAVGLIVWQLKTWLGGYGAGFWAAFLAAVFVIFYAACDLLPKMLFRMFPTRLCLIIAGPFRYLQLLLSPFTALVATLTRVLLRWSGGRTFTGDLFVNREEMRQLMQESAQNLTSEERAMISRALDLQNVPVSQIMKPMDQTVAVDINTPMRDVLAVWREKKSSRLPVWRTEDGQKRVAGVVSMNKVLYLPNLHDERPVGDFVNPALFLDADTRLETALARMQRGGRRLAIVLGRNQREVGVVSLQDILRFIFGEVNL